MRLPDANVLDWIGEVEADRSLPIATHNRFVSAGFLTPQEFHRVWYIERREDAGGSITWEGSSLAGALFRQRNPPNDPLDVFQYLAWRPSLLSEFVVEIPVIERWPYGVLGACGIDSAQLVPSLGRLWFFRSTQCPDDPEAGTAVGARLHGFDASSREVTPAEGLPLRGQVFWNSAFSPTMQSHMDDSVSYLIEDRGTDGSADPALYWERRDATGALVARSEALATARELRGTGNVWTQVTEDDTVFFSAELTTTPPAVVFARIEADGSLGWLHRFSGFVANDGTNRSRVHHADGGIAALVSRPDGSERSILRIDADGSVRHAPAEFAMGRPLDVGDGPSYSAALAPDASGVTVAVALGSDSEPIRISRYDWEGGLMFDVPLADTRSGGVVLLARADGDGGAYVLTPGASSTGYQHVDEFGRLAGYRRITSCAVGPNIEENVPYERGPIDTEVDAALPSDAGPGVDGGML